MARVRSKVNYSIQISHVVRNDKSRTIAQLRSLTAALALFDSRLKNVRNDKIETIKPYNFTSLAAGNRIMFNFEVNWLKQRGLNFKRIKITTC